MRGVSFTLHEREVHALVGENGAGKSTLIKIISGALRPDEGTIAVRGVTHTRLSAGAAHKEGIACIYQQPALFPDLTVAENIWLRLETAGFWKRVSWRRRRERARELLDSVGAGVHPDKEALQLSMPEQQLVEIACAVGAGARVLIMDEPTASLSQADQTRLFGIVHELRKSGVGIIYISHRLEEVFGLADRITVLRDGLSVTSMPAREVDQPSLIQLMIGREVSHVYPPGTASTGEVALSLRHISSSQAGVSDVSLDVYRGEVLGLAGLVGAGRTELAQTVFGITPASHGSITLDGRVVRIRHPREAVALGLAYVPEDRIRHGIIGEMPLHNNITLAIHRRLFPWGWLRLGAERSLALEFLQKLRVACPGVHVPAAALSGGNQQKISVARWLATVPKVLILDEPTQGIDVGAKAEIHRLIRDLAAQGLAVILISSDLPEVLGMSDRIGVMRRGTLAAVLPGGVSAQQVMACALGQGGAA